MKRKTPFVSGISAALPPRQSRSPKPVRALRDARVVDQRIEAQYGKTVCLEFTKRYRCRRRTFRVWHCFLDSVAVRPGSLVHKGDVIGHATGAVYPVVVRQGKRRGDRPPTFEPGTEVSPFVYKGVQ